MEYDVISTKQMIFLEESTKSDTASLRSLESHCVLVKQKQPIGNMQPETRSPAHRASHRPQSRDTPGVLLIQTEKHRLLPNHLVQTLPNNQKNHKHRLRHQLVWPISNVDLEMLAVKINCLPGLNL